MLNDEDISKLVSVLASKKDMEEIKNDFSDLKELVQGLIVSTDNMAKTIGNLGIEYSAISSQLTRHENWIKQIAEKIGLKLASEI